MMQSELHALSDVTLNANSRHRQKLVTCSVVKVVIDLFKDAPILISGAKTH